MKRGRRRLFRLPFLDREGAARELEDELGFHIEMRVRELMEAGVPESAARRRVVNEFGDLERTRDYCEGAMMRREWRRRWGRRLDDLSQTMKHAWRTLRRKPGFTAFAALILGLGIGASATVFAVVDAALLQPLPYRSADELVMVWTQFRDWDRSWLANADYVDFRGAASLRSLEAWTVGAVNVAGADEPERVPAAFVTGGLFDALGVEAAHGRTFAADEDVPGGPDVVVLAHELWARRYGADPSLIGRTIRINGTPQTVIGVLPRGFALPTDFAGRPNFQEQRRLGVYAPLGMDWSAVDRTSRSNNYLYGVGRLAAGATRAQAGAEIGAIATRARTEGLYEPEQEYDAYVVSVADEAVGGARPALLILFGAVGLLLLIGCVNVASLLLARGESRHRELALRRALGAGRGRLLRQLLAESGLVAALGSAVGLALAAAAIRILATWGPARVPRLDTVGLDPGILLFLVGAGTATALLSGLAPALRFSRVDPGPALAAEPGRVAGAGGGRRLRRVLMAGEIAIAVILLVGASLMARTFLNLRGIDTGFRVENALTARITLPAADYPEVEDIIAFYRTLDERLARTGGVEAAGAARLLPLSSVMLGWITQIEGREPDFSDQGDDWQIATPGYFDAMGLPLIRGRHFTSADAPGRPTVAVVNQRFATRYWPDADPLGKRFRIGSETAWITVVGVVADAPHNSLTDGANEKFYLPHAQFADHAGWTPRAMSVVLRTTGEPGSVAPALRSVVREIDPDLPLSDVQPLEDVVARAMSESTFVLYLLAAFAAAALLLSAIGVYGVIAYLVGRRRREIGVRIAVGADPARIRRLVLRDALVAAAAGGGAGLAAALALSRLLEGMLYDVAPADPLSYGVVASVMVGTALLAALVPARRAARLDPADILRDG